MSLARILRRWLPLLVLCAIAYASWQASQSADTDEANLAAVPYTHELGTPIVSARRVPETLQAPVADDAIQPAIDRFLIDLQLAQPGLQTCLTVQVEGRELAAEGDNLALIPASNQKLLTTFAALEQFGPDYSFDTLVAHDGDIVDGVVEGNLYFIGGGDPFLVTDDWRTQYIVHDEDGNEVPPEYPRPWTRLEDLADRLAATGITSVTGSLIADESLFDDVRQGPWADRLIAQNQSGPLSALTVNEGFTRWDSANPAASLRTKSENPPLNAANVLARLLSEREIGVGSTTVGVRPPATTELARISSPPMSAVVTHVNSWSNNYGAEILLKHLGLAISGEGSTEAGAAALKASLAANPEFNLRGIVIDDGSGLAETDRVTCVFLNKLLTVAGFDSTLRRSLSIGGERGSLAGRHDETDADGNLWGKTGTLNPATALSGFVDSPEDADSILTFGYISNADLVDDSVKALQEPFVEELMTYPDAPPVSDLDPLDPVLTNTGG